MFEGVPAQLVVAVLVIWGCVQILNAVGKVVPMIQKSGRRELAKSEVITSAAAPALAPTAALACNHDTLNEKIDGLCGDVRDIKATQEGHGRILGNVRERLSRVEGKLEGPSGATGPHTRHDGG